MNSNEFVVNASPIISLAKIGHADLLLALARKVVVPRGVYEEILAYRSVDPAARWLSDKESSLVQQVTVPSFVAAWNLGKGESEVIAFAHDNRTFGVVIDDRPAKRCAQVLGIAARGTIAVICEAKRNGLVDSAGALLMQLQANGFRISEPLLVTALKLVDEA